MHSTSVFRRPDGQWVCEVRSSSGDGRIWSTHPTREAARARKREWSRYHRLMLPRGVRAFRSVHDAEVAWHRMMHVGDRVAGD